MVLAYNGINFPVADAGLLSDNVRAFVNTDTVSNLY
jgi:hypothetical protein